ncbi:MAG: M13 family peptidase, partial [Xanthomonadaceae bacterium]|nr:M13 family peptidase [Xanthomonadaceae bacterium]
MYTSRQFVLAATIGLIVTLTSIPDADAQRRRTTPQPVAASAPCRDFYSHINADWLKANPLTDGNDTITALGQLSERALLQQRNLLDNAMNTPKTNAQKLLGDFWASGLDEAAVERDGSHPI